MKERSFHIAICILFCVAATTSKVPQHRTSSTTATADTLHVLLGEKNIFYYYEGVIEKDASNFMAADAGEIVYVVDRFIYEYKKKNKEGLVVLKILNGVKINEVSRSAVELIRKRNYKQMPPTELEKELIRITESQ